VPFLLLSLLRPCPGPAFPLTIKKTVDSSALPSLPSSPHAARSVSSFNIRLQYFPFPERLILKPFFKISQIDLFFRPESSHPLHSDSFSTEAHCSPPLREATGSPVGDLLHGGGFASWLQPFAGHPLLFETIFFISSRSIHAPMLRPFPGGRFSLLVFFRHPLFPPGDVTNPSKGTLCLPPLANPRSPIFIFRPLFCLWFSELF